MQNKPTPQEALANLYQIACTAKLTDAENAGMKVCVQILDAIINPKPAEEAK